MTVLLQKGIDPDTSRPVWLVLGEDYAPVEPIQRYLNYLVNLERSPNTVESYGRYLKVYWEYVTECRLEWRNISLEDLSEYMHWLRIGNTNVTSMQPVQVVRSERTVNHAMTVVQGFYEFHHHLGTVGHDKRFTRFNLPIERRYKSFLAGIAKAKPVRKSLLRLREPKEFAGCLTSEEVKTLIRACNTRRDKLIIKLLYETGMRKGELLGLRHEDMGTTGENEISIVPRLNVNGARAKSGKRVVPVSCELMQVYNDYLIEEYPEVNSDYVFVNVSKGEIGAPLQYRALNQLFEQVEKKTGIHAYPHLFRHTHATQLIKEGWDIYHVSQRLGHTSIRTTLDIYGHLTKEDLRAVVEKEEKLDG
jgi:site-specific recombinase XerD